MTGTAPRRPVVLSSNDVAVVIEVVPTRHGNRMLRVACPRCDGPHLFGWPVGERVPGWRVPHCGIGGDYFVPPPTIGGAR